MEWIIVGHTDLTSTLVSILKQKGMLIKGVKSRFPRASKLSKDSLLIIDIDAFTLDELLSHLINHEGRYSNIELVFVTSESEHEQILGELGYDEILIKQELMVNSLISAVKECKET